MARRFSSLITSENPNNMYAGSRNGVKIDTITLHHNAGTNKNAAMATWYVGSGAWTSAHYECTPTETIGCVEETYAAYHCGGTGGSDIPKLANPNQRSIGIENVNSSGAPNWSVDPRTIKRCAALVRDLCDYYGIPCDRKHVLGHNEITATACPGGIDVDEVVRLANGGTATAPTKPTTPPVNNGGAIQGKWYPENGTFVVGQGVTPGVKINGLPLTVNYSGNGALIANIPNGQVVKYDALCHIGGYVWIRQPRGNGYGYMATGNSKNGIRQDYWGTFK